MATILKLKHPTVRKPQTFLAGHTAEIVLFTGVRYERWESTEQPKADVGKRKRRTKAKRPAQSIAL